MKVSRKQIPCTHFNPNDPNTITEWYCCQCGRYHGIPPERYDCTRCNHMMCPYCPKRRIKDMADKS
ncbi:conserved hypothetical protein [Geotrichum candidum]|uniref:Uncharacterized protein n=1 Tax=Geotrichum candidum TaxID=1173061 RepID=A0A0J9X4W8_GEOCN|nr:conserved hypothetical protein [Geotrichum candidum]